MFGSHFIIDANECEEDITNLEHIKNFVNDLCEISNMTKKGDLIVEDFEENEFNIKNDLVGFSVVQIISLSNITLHINFISKTIYFDFFTCGKINIGDICSLFQKYFKAKTFKTLLLNRDAIDLRLPFLNYYSIHK